MSSCNRYTFAIILGVLNFLLSVGYFIVLCINFGKNESERKSSKLFKNFVKKLYME